MKTKILYVVLSIVFLCDLFFIYSAKTEERFFTKTLLIPLLILIYISESKRLGNSIVPRLNKLFFIGLVFSFFGDLFLLFKWGFLPGLVSFLLAHIFYIVCFKNLSKTKISNIYLIFIGLYLVALLVFLFPHLGEMKIPVIIYGITISTMLYFSLRTSNKILIFGAMLFVVSDSLLAINLFVKETMLLNILVMVTYVFAQLLLVKGILNSKN